MTTRPLTRPLRARPGVTRRLRDETGLTLIEVMATALIVVLIASATAAALISTAHFSGDQRFRSQADAIATQDQERMRGMSDEQLGQLNGSGGTRTVTVDGSNYTVRSTAAYVDSSGGSSCASGSANFYKVTSTVSWTEAFSSQPQSVTEESLLSRPISGDLRTQVEDGAAQGVPGATVSVSGAGSDSATTDASGCTLMAGLTPGFYNVTVTPPSGYVDINGGTGSFTGTATVTATGVSSTNNSPFIMGQAGSIAGTFTTNVPSASGPGNATGESDGISWLGSGGTWHMTSFQTATAGSPAPSLTTGPLFPFSSTTAPAAPTYTGNYTVWAGRCLQQEPPAAYDQFTVTPGSVGQAQSVLEPAIDLLVTYQGQPVRPAHLEMTFSSTAGSPSCSYSWHPTIASAAGPTPPATGWLASPGQPFASTATSGPTASAASASSPEAGSLSICADYVDPSTGLSHAGYLNGVTNTDFTTSPPPTTVAITSTSAGSCP